MEPEEMAAFDGPRNDAEWAEALASTTPIVIANEARRNPPVEPEPEPEVIPEPEPQTAPVADCPAE